MPRESPHKKDNGYSSQLSDAWSVLGPERDIPCL